MVKIDQTDGSAVFDFTGTDAQVCCEGVALAPRVVLYVFAPGRDLESLSLGRPITTVVSLETRS